MYKYIITFNDSQGESFTCVLTTNNKIPNADSLYDSNTYSFNPEWHRIQQVFSKLINIEIGYDEDSWFSWVEFNEHNQFEVEKI